MNIENHIKSSLLDQSHLADLLVGEKGQDQKIKNRVYELVDLGLIEVYTYQGEEILTLPKMEAISIINHNENWLWVSKSEGKKLYFISPITNDSGELKYGI